MPHIRHTATLYNEEGDQVGELVGYTETPYGEDSTEWPQDARVHWADAAHDAWKFYAIETEWEETNQ